MTPTPQKFTRHQLLQARIAVSIAFFLLGSFGPMAAGALVTRYSGASLKEWARPIVKWRVRPRFYRYALGLPTAIWVVINVQLAVFSDDFDLSLLPGRLLGSIGTFLVVLTVGGAFEEPGWRGFALPRLQARMSPVRATLLLGFLWGVWHVPVYGPLAFAFPIGFVQALKALGSSPSTKWVLPLELTQLGERVGNYIARGFSAPPGAPGQASTRTADAPSMGSVGGQRREPPPTAQPGG